jgi:hypothetical protein
LISTIEHLLVQQVADQLSVSISQLTLLVVRSKETNATINNPNLPEQIKQTAQACTLFAVRLTKL